MSIRWSTDQISDRAALGDEDSTLLPKAGKMLAPSLLEPPDESIRSSQKENPRQKRVPSSQNGQVLDYDRLKEGSHQFMAGDTLLLQTVDVGL